MGQLLDNDDKIHGFDLPEDEEERSKKIDELKKMLTESKVKGFQVYQKLFEDQFKIEPKKE